MDERDRINFRGGMAYLKLCLGPDRWRTWLISRRRRMPRPDPEDVDRGTDVRAMEEAWRASLPGLREAVETFAEAIQEIVDDKATAGERYDARAYKLWLSMRGLARAEPDRLEAEEVKSRVRIEDVVGRYRELRDRGKYFQCRCPFHGDDRNASACVYKDSQNFHCFACGEHHDAISFVMKMENMTFIQALKYLNETS